jgi:outer membrane lipopolysaccharide assembly protein LptE/RlpB
MSLTKPNQELRRDLKQAVAMLKLSGVDLMQAAVRLSESGQEAEAKEVLKIAADFQEVEDRLAGYAEEVKVGRIVRGKVE